MNGTSKHALPAPGGDQKEQRHSVARQVQLQQDLQEEPAWPFPLTDPSAPRTHHDDANADAAIVRGDEAAVPVAANEEPVMPPRTTSATRSVTTPDGVVTIPTATKDGTSPLNLVIRIKKAAAASSDPEQASALTEIVYPLKATEERLQPTAVVEAAAIQPTGTTSTREIFSAKDDVVRPKKGRPSSSTGTIRTPSTGLTISSSEAAEMKARTAPLEDVPKPPATPIGSDEAPPGIEESTLPAVQDVSRAPSAVQGITPANSTGEPLSSRNDVARLRTLMTKIAAKASSTDEPPTAAEAVEATAHTDPIVYAVPGEDAPQPPSTPDERAQEAVLLVDEEAMSVSETHENNAFPATQEPPRPYSAMEEMVRLFLSPTDTNETHASRDGSAALQTPTDVGDEAPFAIDERSLPSFETAGYTALPATPDAPRVTTPLATDETGILFQAPMNLKETLSSSDDLARLHTLLTKLKEKPSSSDETPAAPDQAAESGDLSAADEDSWLTAEHDATSVFDVVDDVPSIVVPVEPSQKGASWMWQNDSAGTDIEIELLVDNEMKPGVEGDVNHNRPSLTKNGAALMQNQPIPEIPAAPAHLRDERSRQLRIMEHKQHSRTLFAIVSLCVVISALLSYTLGPLVINTLTAAPTAPAKIQSASSPPTAPAGLTSLPPLPTPVPASPTPKPVPATPKAAPPTPTKVPPAPKSAPPTSKPVPPTPTPISINAANLSPTQLYDAVTKRTPSYSSSLTTQDKAQWDITTDAYGNTCNFVNDVYEASSVGSGFVTTCLEHAFSVTNFGFQVQMTIRSGKIDDGGGLIFRGTNGDAIYRLRVGVDGSYDLTHTSLTALNPAIRTGLNQSNTVTVIAQGPLIFLYVNQQCIAQLSDTFSSQGNIGFMAVGAQATVVDYTNVQVWTF